MEPKHIDDVSQPTLQREGDGGSRVHLPRKENARIRHQRLFKENVRKTGKGVVYEL